MKITAVLGSPRENSVSTRIAKKALQGAREAGHEVRLYHIQDMEVMGCQGCGCCRKHNTDCVIEDDMESYFQDLRESGALIVTSPNYYSQIAGPMITFMNRHYCLTGKDHLPRLEPGKKLVGILSEGMPKPYEASEKNFRWFLECLSGRSMTVLEPLFASAGMKPEDLDALMEKAYETGKSL